MASVFVSSSLFGVWVCFCFFFFLLFFPKAWYRWGRSRLCKCSSGSFTCRRPGNAERAEGLRAAVEHPTHPAEPPAEPPAPPGEGRDRGPVPRLRGKLLCRVLAWSGILAGPLAPRDQGDEHPAAAQNKEQQVRRKPYHHFLLIFQMHHKKNIVLGTCVTN